MSARDTRSRAAKIRAAMLADLTEAPYGLTLAEMQRANRTVRLNAGSRAEVHQAACRLMRDHLVARSGAGYANGETFLYRLAEQEPA